MKMKGFRRIVALAALAAVVAVGGVVRAQGGQFQQIAGVLRRAGYSHVVDSARGWLRDGRSDSFSIWLSAGTQYALVANCDDDCTDVDIALYGPDGRALASDDQLDDAPVVLVTPGRSGTHRVKVTMADCEVQPCAYTVGVFSR